MVTDDDEILITGTATGISKTNGIKSPYIASYDVELNLLKKYNFPTPSTALNPKLEQLFDGSHLLYFYRAESKDIQTEHSHLLYLDQNYNIKTEKKFGRRTRIELLAAYKKDYISYQYERAKLNTSISIYKDSTSNNKKTFALSEESNIPTDLLIKSDSSIFISGIANGFSYRDGHQYLNPSANGYILKLNQELLEEQRHITNNKQHSFIKNLESHGELILSTGTIQNDSTGMDIYLQYFTDNLEEKWNFTYKVDKAQEGIKSISKDGVIHTLCKTINAETKKSNILLLQFDKEKLKHAITLTRNGSYDPKDFVITQDYIYVIATRQSSRTSDMQSVIIKLDKSGIIIQEKIIE